MKVSKLQARVVGLLVVVALLAVACAPAEPAKPAQSAPASAPASQPAQAAPATKPGEKLLLCSVYPLSGSVAEGGTDTWAGAQVAVDLINEAGGVKGLYGGVQVELLRADGPTADAVASETERLISQRNCKIILGTYASSFELAGSAVAERNKVIWWGTGGATGQLTARGYKYYFRTVDSSPTYGATNAGFILDVVAKKLNKAPQDLKVFITYEDSDFGTSAAKATEADLKKANVKIVGFEGHPATTNDLSSTVLKAKAAAPDILVPCTYTLDWTLFWRQAKELNFYVPVVNGCANQNMDPNFIKAAGKDAEGVFANDAPWQSEKMSAELLKLKADVGARLTKYTGRPMSGPSVRGFVPTYVLLTEILPKTGSLEADKIIDAAMKLDLPLGSTIGGWGVKYDEKHENTRATNAMYQIQNGERFIVWPQQYATKEPIMIPLPTWDKR